MNPGQRERGRGSDCTANADGWRLRGRVTAFLCWRGLQSNPHQPKGYSAPEPSHRCKLWFLLSLFPRRWWRTGLPLCPLHPPRVPREVPSWQGKAGTSFAWAKSERQYQGKARQVFHRAAILLARTSLAVAPVSTPLSPLGCDGKMIQQRPHYPSNKLDDYFLWNHSVFCPLSIQGQLKTNINVKNRKVKLISTNNDRSLKDQVQQEWPHIQVLCWVKRAQMDKDTKSKTKIFEKRRATSSGVFIWQEPWALKDQYFTKITICNFAN